jgi:hypothetical protein
MVMYSSQYILTVQLNGNQWSVYIDAKHRQPHEYLPTTDETENNYFLLRMF